MFALSNLRYSNLVDDVPWVHLSPCGWQGRTASGQEPSPLVGWLWVGGRVHLGVWHSEYRCLMNGSHDNFQFTQVAAEDPTANADATYTDENGAGLRDTDRFCLWCQEIVTLRILEKTDQLLEDGDPGNVTSQGAVWYARWLERLRSNYYQLFGVAQQIAERGGALRRPDARAQRRTTLAVGPLLGPEGRRRGPGIAGAARVG